MGKLKQAIYGKRAVIIKEQQNLPGMNNPGAPATDVPSTTMFVVVRVSADGIGAPVGVYSDSSRAEAARDTVEPAQVYELMLNAEPDDM